MTPLIFHVSLDLCIGPLSCCINSAVDAPNILPPLLSFYHPIPPPSPLLIAVPHEMITRTFDFDHESRVLLGSNGSQPESLTDVQSLYIDGNPSEDATLEYLEYPNCIHDPHLEFPNTLIALRIFNFPLFPSFYTITTLTALVINHKKFPNTLKDISTILKGNLSLEDVKLEITFSVLEPPSGFQNDLTPPKPEDLESKGSIELKQLKFLKVQGGRPEDTRKLIDLISCISFPTNARVDVKFDTLNGGRELKDALSSIKDFVTPPTHLLVDFEGLVSVEFPGPNGSSLRFLGVQYQDMASMLMGKCLPFFKEVWNLHLKLGGTLESPLLESPLLESPPLEPSPFPSLKTLAIDIKTNPRIYAYLSLKNLLSSPETFSLDRLEIKDVRFNSKNSTSTNLFLFEPSKPPHRTISKLRVSGSTTISRRN